MKIFPRHNLYCSFVIYAILVYSPPFFYLLDNITASLPRFPIYTGYAILVINSYNSQSVKYPQIHGSAYDENILRNSLVDVGFYVNSLFCAKYIEFETLFTKMKLSEDPSHYSCLLIIFCGYQENSQLIFEDGIGIDYQRIFNFVVDPLSIFSKLPKIIIINTYKPSRSSIRSLFGKKPSSIPFCKSPYCLTMHIVHDIGAAEKRGSSIQDTFVSKFVEEIHLSNSLLQDGLKRTFDFSVLLKNVYHSITSQSKIANLNLLVRIDDQLFTSICCRIKSTNDVSDAHSVSFQEANVDRNLSDSLINELQTITCFHGKISREESEVLLDYEGDFLIRQSTSDQNFGKLVFSVLYSNLLYQIPIIISPYGVGFENQLMFPTLSSMLEYYLDNKHVIPTHSTFVKIIHPVRFHFERSLVKIIPEICKSSYSNEPCWMHGRVNQKYVQNLLQNEGDFLVWETGYEYVLSYVYNSKIQSIYTTHTKSGNISTDLIAGEFEDIYDLVQHLVLHYTYYRGVILQTPIINSGILAKSQKIDVFISPRSSPVASVKLTPQQYYVQRNDICLGFIDLSISLTKQKWFSKSLTSDLACEILKYDGDFLVRTSQSRPGHLSLSVRVSGDVQTYGVFITGRPSVYTLDPHSEFTFSSVVEMINHYMYSHQPLPVSVGPQAFLINPIDIEIALNSLNKL